VRSAADIETCRSTLLTIRNTGGARALFCGTTENLAAGQAGFVQFQCLKFSRLSALVLAPFWWACATHTESGTESGTERGTAPNAQSQEAARVAPLKTIDDLVAEQHLGQGKEEKPLTPGPAPDKVADLAWLEAEGPARSPQSGRRLVSLTFDDGPGPRTTDAVLRVLKKHEVQATFFMIGQYMDRASQRGDRMRASAQHIVAAGHLVGNHTYTHRRLSALSPAEIETQLDRTQDSIEAVTGVRPAFFRPPFGDLSSEAAALLPARNLRPVLWSIEAEDMQTSDAAHIANELEDRLTYAQGGIVLLHDVKWATVRALDALLTWLKVNRYDSARPERLGFEVVGLEAYLRETQASPQPFASRDTLLSARKRTREIQFASKREAKR
jgi:peptidoglycan-N-acetylglucosamine deacetylase